MKQNLGARLRYTEQYCMSSIITASHLGASTAWSCIHVCRVKLASQRVKEYHKKAHAWHLNMHTVRVEKKPLSPDKVKKLRISK